MCGIYGNAWAYNTNTIKAALPRPIPTILDLYKNGSKSSMIASFGTGSNIIVSNEARWKVTFLPMSGGQGMNLDSLLLQFHLLELQEFHLKMSDNNNTQCINIWGGGALSIGASNSIISKRQSRHKSVQLENPMESEVLKNIIENEDMHEDSKRATAKFKEDYWKEKEKGLHVISYF